MANQLEDGAPLKPSSSLRDAGIRDGDTLTAVLHDAFLVANRRSFLLGGASAGASLLRSWDTSSSSSSSSSPPDVTEVLEIQSTPFAFSAVKADGSVVTWGRAEEGGDSAHVQEQLEQVTQIQATEHSFAALRADGTVVSWGDADFGGDSSHVQAQLHGVRCIQRTSRAFAALKIDGTVAVWGDPHAGGKVNESVQEQLQNVKEIQAYWCHPMVHYNSWYDFYSYQDEGFNGEEMVTKRKTKLDSSLWEFDQQRFPRRFDEVAKRAKDFGAGTGVWLSPWGGYGFTQEARVKFGKKQGYETNYNKNIQSEGFSLAGKKYQKAFHETAMRFRREQGVNMFKFDGVAGNPTELAMEMEAMLRTLAQLRNQKSQKDDEDWGKNERTGNRRNMTPSGRLATVTATRRPERSSFTRRPSGGPPGTWKNTDGGPRVTADLGLELAGGLEDWLVGPATSVVRLEVRMEGEGETTCVS
eukprot:g4266.t2